MLQLLALLTLVIPFPVWLLMIARPQDARTRQITGSYYVFILLGALYIFLLVGSLFSYLNLQATLSSAMESSAGASSADAVSTLSAAVKSAGSGLSTLTWVVLAGGGIMDLLGGHYIYHDTQKRGLSQMQAGIFLVLTYILGAIGFGSYIAWRYLTDLKTQGAVVPPPAVVNTVTSTPAPSLESVQST